MTTLDFGRERQKMRRKYLEGCSQRMAEVRRLASAWLDDGHEASAPLLGRALHRLSGSAGTFGYPEIGDVARTAEDLVRRFQGTYVHRDRHRLRAALDELARVVTREVQRGLLAEDELGSDDLDRRSGFGSRRSDGRPLVQFLSAETEARFGLGLREARFRTVATLDLRSSDSPLAVVGTREELERHPGLALHPRVALLSSDSFEDRLAAARVGAQLVMVEPVDEESLIEQLDELRGSVQFRPYTVLVVDDDEEQARNFATIIKDNEMEAHWVTKARDVLGAVREHRPDVLLTDIVMPECSGVELASVVRQDATLLTIPVVFMSADERYRREPSPLQHDGDAFFAKEQPLPALIELLRAKARRSRALESSMTVDGMTGLLRHAVFKVRFDAELARAQRQDEVISCALIDIDHFKKVNDVHGHATGDRVIQALGRLLRRRCRAHDITARYGGEEFAIALPNTTSEQAHVLVDELRRRFARMSFASPRGALSATFSAGIASYPLYSERDQVLVAADEALYRAKAAGRNRVVVSQGTGSRPSSE